MVPNELFASLVDDRAHFGYGIYASALEPARWLRCLLNNYSRGNPWRAEPNDDEGQRVLQEWGDRVSFCIPILVNEELAFDIFQRQPPDLKATIERLSKPT